MKLFFKEINKFVYEIKFLKFILLLPRIKLFLHRQYYHQFPFGNQKGPFNPQNKAHEPPLYMYFFKNVKNYINEHCSLFNEPSGFVAKLGTTFSAPSPRISAGG